MTFTQPAQRRAPRPRIRRVLLAGLLVVVAAFAVGLGDQRPASSSAPSSASAGSSSGEAGGAVPAGTTVFDDAVPGVAKLDPGLRGALRAAAKDAASDGVAFVVDSGWRSPGYQARLLQEAVATYGSEAQAARWVATPDTSAHVSGDAVDVGSAAAAWLAGRGAAYGLCPVYGNEPWHYELRSEAAADGCPPPYPDPTHDPRMQR